MKNGLTIPAMDQAEPYWIKIFPNRGCFTLIYLNLGIFDVKESGKTLIYRVNSMQFYQSLHKITANKI